MPGAVLVLFPTHCTQRAAHHHCSTGSSSTAIMCTVLHSPLPCCTVRDSKLMNRLSPTPICLHGTFPADSYYTTSSWCVSCYLHGTCTCPAVITYSYSCVSFTWCYISCCSWLLYLLCPAQHFQSLTLTCCFLFSSL